MEGRVQRGEKGAFAPGEAREDWTIFRAVSELLGQPLAFDTFGQLHAAMAADHPQLATPGLLSGAVLAFGRSLGEFGATITFVSSIPGETRTIASGIYALLQTPDGDAEVLRLCAVSLVLSFGSLVISELLIRAGQRRLAQ